MFVGYNLTELLYIINMCTKGKPSLILKRTVHWTLTRHQNAPHSHDMENKMSKARLLSALSSLVNNVGSRWQLTSIFKTCYIHSQTKIWASKVPDLYKISRHLLFYLNCWRSEGQNCFVSAPSRIIKQIIKGQEIQRGLPQTNGEGVRNDSPETRTPSTLRTAGTCKRLPLCYTGYSTGMPRG